MVLVLCGMKQQKKRPREVALVQVTKEFLGDVAEGAARGDAGTA